jgi:hypothetical protein
MKPETFEQTKARWTESLSPLIGLMVADVRYLTPEECDRLGWRQSTVVIEFDDGTVAFPSRDDEGNDGGALFLQPSAAMRKLKLPDTAPVIRDYRAGRGW